MAPAWLLWCCGLAPALAASTSDRLLAENCNGCHGTNGVSAGPTIPSFAGFDRQYLIRILQDYRDGERTPTIMDRIMRGYSGPEIRRIATYFAAQPWIGAAVVTDPRIQATGEQIHDQVCAECHEQQGRHQDRDTPRIAGQWPDYLVLQMQTYRDRPEAMPQPTKMLDAMAELSDDEIQALAWFYAAQP
ncbi:MAG: cytochrome c, class I [Sphingobacteriia bacterium]|nr:cytochrome c, class I [Sphingobacteriia bacterium]NCC39757.1 cytochrome c, class I [Gammaproteobacteria bacterium]